MKQSLAAASVIAAIALACMYTVKITTAYCDEVKNSALMCIDAAESNNWHDAARHINSIKAKSKKQQYILELFLSHQDLSEISKTISKAEAAIAFKSAQFCVSEASILIGQLENIASSDKLTIGNVL